jgi:hypothetical protein
MAARATRGHRESIAVPINRWERRLPLLFAVDAAGRSAGSAVQAADG